MADLAPKAGTLLALRGEDSRVSDETTSTKGGDPSLSTMMTHDADMSSQKNQSETEKEDGSAEAAPTPCPPGPPHPPSDLPLAKRVLLVAITMFVIVLGAGGQQGLNIALPSMQKDLDIPQNDLQWIASAYGLASGCLVPLSGRLADVHGRKVCFILGIGWNAVWTLVGSFLHNRIGVIVTRALAGMGASMG